jgi:hypothetical protein
MAGVVVFTLVSTFSQSHMIARARWAFLAAFFTLTVVRLFSYLKSARTVNESHLVTAVSIYLLLGMLWFALYNVIELSSPDAILHKSVTATDRQSELRYFSLVTLTTIGYGDIVPVQGEVRMLAALEGVTGGSLCGDHCRALGQRVYAKEPLLINGWLGLPDRVV